MNAAADLLELLPPAVAGRIETLAGQPIRTIGDRLDDRTATVATLTVVLAQLADVDLAEAAGSHRTVVALRRAVDAAVLTRARKVIADVRAAQAEQADAEAAAAGDGDAAEAPAEEGGGT